MTDAEYLAVVRGRLGGYRFTHSLGVAESAKVLAARYGADEQKAYTAGLLHDVMKDTANEEQLALFAEYGVRLLPEEQIAPQLWHAIAGECFAKQVLGVCDADILAAIRYHTTGRAGMSLLEKVVFTADFISIDRVYPGVERMREKAQISLDAAMAEGFQFTMTKLLADEKAIHPDMLAGYNEIILKWNQNKKGDC
ncbi:MAG: bis(5'-nucleosyl)-tetraphosphatase (symmetrical) YqeK [Oscillospiraceae bacterium]|nr:bis(5'-nucleosyl)-tetraphosphatase (symmetrical) YqeK [Oscillospiraceae bacterium]